MRVLRTNAYIEADSSPVTAVMRDCDLADTIESAEHQLVSSNPTPGVLVINEVFDAADDTSIREASVMALARVNTEREKYMALMYHWVGDVLASVTPTGTLMMDKPTPLDSESMRVVFDQIKQHPNYQQQIVVGFDSDGNEVRLDPEVELSSEEEDEQDQARREEGEDPK